MKTLFDFVDDSASDAAFGYPKIRKATDSLLFMCDWRGALSLIDLQAGKILAQTSAKNSSLKLSSLLLRSLGVSQDGNRCVVATQGGFAVQWEPNNGKLLHILPEFGSPVHSVCLIESSQNPHQRNSLLALGVGEYSGSSRAKGTRVEIWDLSFGEPELRSAQALPGCIVDAITYDESADTLLCVSGIFNEDCSFATTVGVETGACESFAYVHGTGTSTARAIDVPHFGSHLLCCSRSLQLALKPDWSKWVPPIDFQHQIFDVAISPDESRAIATDGTVVSLNDFSAVDAIDLPNNTCSLEFLSPKEVVCATTDGKICLIDLS